MARMTISMPDAMQAFINAEIATGKYDNASEYVRDLVRHRQERKETAIADLRQLLDEARASGVSSDASMPEVIQRVHERLRREGHEISDS